MSTGGAAASDGSAARAGILSIPRAGIFGHSEAEARDGFPVRLPRQQSPPPSSNVDRSTRYFFVPVPHRWYTTQNFASTHCPLRPWTNGETRADSLVLSPWRRHPVLGR